MKSLQTYFFIALVFVFLSACSSAEGDFGGSEYMPDMGHSIAYEANIYNYYEHNTWDDESTIKLKDLSNLHDPVKGTIPRGYAGVALATNGAERSAIMAHHNGETALFEQAIPVNGEAPYYYADTEEERTRAMAEILGNPFPITEKGLAKGKEMFDLNCAICHGKKGDGLGYLVNDEKNKNVKYPAAPANFLSDQFLTASNGRYYHAIMYGKNVMGSFSDRLSYEERWQVIHYIRSLQAKKAGAKYSEEKNTYNSVYGTPGAMYEAASAVVETVEEAPQHEEHHEDTHGGDAHGH